MKKSMNSFKLKSIYLLAFLLVNITLISCSGEEMEKENFIENSLKYNDKLYVSNSEGSSTSKYVGNVFKYNIFVENINLASTERRISSNVNDDLIIRNSENNETIEIINVHEHEGYYTFDLLTNLGHQFDNLTYYGEMFQTNTVSRCPICVEIVVGVVVALVADVLTNDSSNLSDLQLCQAAMNNLDCASGTSPYMQYSSGWFSSTCNVGCN